MGNVANDPASSRRELSDRPPAAGSPGPAPSRRHDEADQPRGGVRVRDVLQRPAFADVTVVAGAAGLDRWVERANVMEVPDIIAWVKPRELLMTTGYPLRDAPDGLVDLVRELDSAGVSALAVKLHRYLDELPRDVIDAADAAGFPILLLPDSASFDDLLTEVVGHVLRAQSTLAERNEAIGRALVSVVLHGGELDELTQALHGEIGGLSFVTTPDGRVLASAPAAECAALADDGDLFAETGRFRSERFAPGAHRVGKLSVSVVALLAGTADHGRLVVVRSDPDRAGSDVPILERAGAVAALAMAKSLAVRAVEAKYRGDFVRDVLLRRAGPPEDVVTHFASLGWDIARPVVVLVASLDPAGSDHDPAVDARTAQERFAGAWSTVVGRHDRTAPVVGFAQEVVVIVSAERGRPARATVENLVRAVSGDSGGGRRTFATGVSRVIDDPTAIADGYEQARRAVHVGRQLQGTSSIAHFDDLGAFRLLSLIEDSQELTNFVKEVLGELAEEADAEAADMRSTLRVLLDTNLNVAETSRRLHFHYNTLRYRISKLEKTVGPFVSDPDLQLDLALALRVMQMRGL